jgi:alanine-glyoxylate transaminase/serine-glyoxylate transaminase/serine-pyruvate transaminase
MHDVCCLGARARRSNGHPRVLAAQTLPLLGHMHPPFIKIMDEVKAGLQYM